MIEKLKQLRQMVENDQWAPGDAWNEEGPASLIQLICRTRKSGDRSGVLFEVVEVLRRIALARNPDAHGYSLTGWAMKYGTKESILEIIDEALARAS